jgi:TRAF3-interacting protein 1
MTEKLLEKPPFRYLHDIFTATMEMTGFGQGLYDENELDSKSITERDAKINFLAKLIALVELMLGEKIDCKPAKVVAGLEPEKTNAFL